MGNPQIAPKVLSSEQGLLCCWSSKRQRSICWVAGVFGRGWEEFVFEGKVDLDIHKRAPLGNKSGWNSIQRSMKRSSREQHGDSTVSSMRERVVFRVLIFEGVVAVVLLTAALGLAFSPWTPSEDAALSRDSVMLTPAIETKTLDEISPRERARPTQWLPSRGDECSMRDGTLVCQGPRRVPRPHGPAAVLPSIRCLACHLRRDDIFLTLGLEYGIRSQPLVGVAVTVVEATG